MSHMSKGAGKKEKNVKRVSFAKPKLSKKITNLRSVLQTIYHDKVNLETTCNHRCECCSIAMPSIQYSEFIQIATTVWGKFSKEAKIDLICTSVDYFFRNEYEKWGKDALVKPCMFLDKHGLCKIYEDRPLNCRIYGQWPKEEYEKRVDKFAKAYEKYGLKREDLPLHEQCPFVKRVDGKTELTMGLISDLFARLDSLDKEMGGFSGLQIEQKENYRTFHDWLLLKIYGEKWLVLLTTFMMAATREQMEDQVFQLKKAINAKFGKEDLPDLSQAF